MFFRFDVAKVQKNYLKVGDSPFKSSQINLYHCKIMLKRRNFHILFLYNSNINQDLKNQNLFELSNIAKKL